MKDTKKNIFDAAVYLFAEKGYSRTSVKEIGKAAGISEPAVYRHYESKAAILDDIISVFGRKLKSCILTEKQVDKYIETDTPRQLLERCIGRFSQEDTLFMFRAYRIVYMEHLTNQTAADLIISQMHDATAESIKYVLDRLMARGKIPTYDAAFYAMLWAQSMFSGAVIWISRYWRGEPLEISSKRYNAVMECVVEMALTGRIPG